jgi:hypothetical protein
MASGEVCPIVVPTKIEASEVREAYNSNPIPSRFERRKQPTYGAKVVCLLWADGLLSCRRP